MLYVAAVLGCKRLPIQIKLFIINMQFKHIYNESNVNTGNISSIQWGAQLIAV